MTLPLRLLLPIVLLTVSEAVTANPHPMLQHLAESADVIVIGTFEEPRVWYPSELTVLAGAAQAVVERKLAGPDPLPAGTKIEFRVVRVLDLTEEVLERRQARQKALQANPPKPQEKIEAVKPRRSILFLKKGRSGTYHAVDGFLFSLPHDGFLEEALQVEIARAKKKRAEK